MVLTYKNIALWDSLCRSPDNPSENLCVQQSMLRADFALATFCVCVDTLILSKSRQNGPPHNLKRRPLYVLTTT